LLGRATHTHGMHSNFSTSGCREAQQNVVARWREWGRNELQKSQSRNWRGSNAEAELRFDHTNPAEHIRGCEKAVSAG